MSINEQVPQLSEPVPVCGGELLDSVGAPYPHRSRLISVLTAAALALSPIIVSPNPAEAQTTGSAEFEANQNGHDGSFGFVSVCNEEDEVVIIGEYFNYEPEGVYAYPSSPDLPDADFDGEIKDVYITDGSSNQLAAFNTHQSSITLSTMDMNVRVAKAGTEYTVAGSGYVEEYTCTDDINPEPTETPTPTESPTGGETTVEFHAVNRETVPAMAADFARLRFDITQLDSVTIAMYDNENEAAFADALVGGTLTRGESPLLYTATQELSPETHALLAESSITNVTILGGEAAISSDVEQVLRDMGFEINRIGGRNRFETAIAVARENTAMNNGQAPEIIFYVNGYKFADAVAFTGLANLFNAQIVLTNDEDFPFESTHTYLEEVSPGVRELIVGGGTAVVTEASGIRAAQAATAELGRIAGLDRWGTNFEAIRIQLEALRAMPGMNPDPTTQLLREAYGVSGENPYAALAVASGMNPLEATAVYLPPTYDHPSMPMVSSNIAEYLKGVDSVTFVSANQPGEFDYTVPIHVSGDFNDPNQSEQPPEQQAPEEEESSSPSPTPQPSPSPSS